MVIGLPAQPVMGLGSEMLCTAVLTVRFREHWETSDSSMASILCHVHE